MRPLIPLRIRNALIMLLSRNRTVICNARIEVPTTGTAVAAHGHAVIHRCHIQGSPTSHGIGIETKEASGA